MNGKNLRGIFILLLYLFSILLSAWLVQYVGVVPVWFGVNAPAGAYVIGLTMVLRDLLQDQLGARPVYVAIIIGALLSAFVSPNIAFASAIGFCISELVDQFVYTPIRKHSLVFAVIISNVVSILVDTIIFLYSVFGNFDYFIGQVLAKFFATIFAVVALTFFYKLRDRKTIHS